MSRNSRCRWFRASVVFSPDQQGPVSSVCQCCHHRRGCLSQCQECCVCYCFLRQEIPDGKRLLESFFLKVNVASLHLPACIPATWSLSLSMCACCCLEEIPRLSSGACYFQFKCDVNISVIPNSFKNWK